MFIISLNIKKEKTRDMPCRLCLLEFYHKPCSSHDPPKWFISGMTIRDSIFWSKYYREISKRCPCMDCLVKTVCGEERGDCEIYESFLDFITNNRG